MYLFDDPGYERRALAEIQQREQQFRLLSSQVTPQMGAAAARMAMLYPTLPNEVLEQAAVMGMDPEDPALLQIATRQAEADSGIWSQITGRAGDAWDGAFRGLKVAARTGFLVFDTLAEEGIGRPTRALVLAAQRESQAQGGGNLLQGILAVPSTLGRLPEALGDVGASTAQLALDELFAGREVNLGSGFLPRSDPETPGAQITDVGRLQREQSVTYRGGPVSPGRFLAHQVSTPGTAEVDVMRGLNTIWQGLQAPGRVITGDPIGAATAVVDAAKTPSGRVVSTFDAISGATDAAIQVYADPAVAAGGVFRSVRQGARLFDSGVVEGVTRSGLLKRTADEWLNSNAGREVVDWIAGTTDYLALRRLIGVSDRSLLRDLAQAPDRATVIERLRPALGMTVREVPGATGVTSRLSGARYVRDRAAALTNMPGMRGLDSEFARVAGLNAAVRQSLSDTRIGRVFAEMPKGGLADAARMDEAVDELDRWMNTASAAFAGEARSFSLADRNKYLLEAAALVDDDYEGLFRVVRRMVGEVDTRLGEEGLSREIRRPLTQVFDSSQGIRNFMGDAMARPAWFPSVKLDSNGEILPTAQLLSQYANSAIHLPDIREVRRALSKWDPYINAGRTLTKEGAGGYGPGAATALVDGAMQKVWKPLVLLRGAWTVRVIAEEQLRMAATGLDSMFKHPLSWITWMRARNTAEAGSGGLLRETEEFQAMMARGFNGYIDTKPRTLAGRGWSTFSADDPNANIKWVSDLNQLVQDPIARRIANEGSEATVDWLKNSEEGREVWERLIRGADSRRDVSELTGPQGIDAYVDSVYANIHGRTGGDFTGPNSMDEFISGTRYEITRNGDQEVIDAIARGEFRGITFDAALDDPALFGRLAERLGELPNTSRPLQIRGPINDFVEGMDRSGYDKLTQFLFDALMSRPTNQLSRSPAFLQLYWRRIEELFPFMDDAAQAHYLSVAGRGGIPRAVQRRLKKAAVRSKPEGFPIMGTDDIPVSFAPLRGEDVTGSIDLFPSADGYIFRATNDGGQSGWTLDPQRAATGAGDSGRVEMFRKVDLPEELRKTTDEFEAEQLRFVDETIKPPVASYSPDEILEGIDEGFLRVGDVLEGQLLPSGTILEGSIDDLDQTGRAFALDGVRDLLFDLSNKNNMEDIIRNFAPFQTAWREIITTWSRIGADSGIVASRRFQQSVEGLREQGFFMTDPITGEQVFTYPMIGEMASAAGFGEDNQVGVEFVGNVTGLNMMSSSVLPQVGPVIQWPAAQLLRDRAGFDWLRNYVLPFGADDIDTPGAFLEANIPPWMEKAVTALGYPTQQGSQSMGNTVIEVLRAMEMTGEFSYMDQAQKEEFATETAQQFMWIRAGVQFAGPTGPRPVLTVEDEDGRIFWLSALAQEYRELTQELDGDTVQATETMARRYGFNPLGIVAAFTSRSESVAPRATTREGLDFQIENEAWFDEFPLTAFYAGPNDNDFEFDFSAWVRQFDDGNRRQFSPEQWQAAANDAKARYLLDTQRTRILGVIEEAGSDVTMNTPEIQTIMRGYKFFLMEEYPGAFRANLGTFESVPLEDKIAELERWSDNEGISATETGQALTRYLGLRRQFVDAYVAAGDNRSPTGFGNAGTAAPLREALAQYAEGQLISEFPEFEPLYRFVLSGELEE